MRFKVGDRIKVTVEGMYKDLLGEVCGIRQPNQDPFYKDYSILLDIESHTLGFNDDEMLRIES
jgi:hypothetical protein